MSEAMEIALESIEPGMVLAEDLRNDAGQVLLSRGAELTEKICEGLKRRGVERVRVVAVTPKPDPEAVRARLDAQFRGTRDDPTMGALRAMLERFHRGGGA